MDCNQLAVDIDNEIVVVYNFLRDRYKTKFPELESLVHNPLDYARVVQVGGRPGAGGGRAPRAPRPGCLGWAAGLRCAPPTLGCTTPARSPAATSARLPLRQPALRPSAAGPHGPPPPPPSIPQAIGNEMDVTLVDLDRLLPPATVMVVTVTATTTSGKPLSEEELK